MSQVTLQKAQTQIASLMEEVLKGHEIVIMENNRPVAKIVPFTEGTPKPHFGSAKHLLIYMAEDFDAPLPDFKEYM